VAYISGGCGPTGKRKANEGPQVSPRVKKEKDKAAPAAKLPRSESAPKPARSESAGVPEIPDHPHLSAFVTAYFL
jgi:hypothetical protein